MHPRKVCRVDSLCMCSVYVGSGGGTGESSGQQNSDRNDGEKQPRDNVLHRFVN